MKHSTEPRTYLPSTTLGRMGRLLLSALAATSLFAATYLGQEAQACDCLDKELPQQYAIHDHVFAGRVLFELNMASTSLYLAFVETNYTGCEAEQGVVWLQTPNDGSSCVTRFSVGESYLFFADEVPGIYSFALSTHECSGNRLMSRLEPEDLEYLQTRQNCCDGSCTCQPGVDEVNCLVDPCSVAAPCDVVGEVRCESNYCGGCHAEFYNSDGERVCLGGETSCLYDDECPESQYCNRNGQCADDGTCGTSGECMLEANDFEVNLDCAPEIDCRDNRCVAECKDKRCVDHKGFDFGPCDAYPGWLILDGECVEVVSGCGTLVPGSMPVFDSKENCESSCNLRANTFACGEKLKCDRTKAYCQDSLPGAEPPLGEPRRYFDCLPLPEKCQDAPSCETCFEPRTPPEVLLPGNNPATCFDAEDGTVFVSVAFP